MILLLLLCLVLAAVLAGAGYAYRKAFYSSYQNRDYLHAPLSRRTERYRAEMERIFIALADRPFEPVAIRSQEGLTLTGRYYHIRDGAPLDLCFHGYRSTLLTDLCCFSEPGDDVGTQSAAGGPAGPR